MILTIIDSLFGIHKILVDTSSDSLTFVGLVSKRTIATVEIVQYFDTIHKNPFKVWYGLQIMTKDKKTIQVVDQNIKSLSYLKDYLN
ncbi:MAG TPA: hypothetical protein VKR53_00700, partial [Puia sp.]|nr:hypothetical protein [Puia sp.]